MPDIQKHKCRVVTDYIHSCYLWIKEKIDYYTQKNCDKCGKRI